MVQIENSLQNNMWIVAHKRVFLGFQRFESLNPSAPLPGGWSLLDCAWYDNLLWNYIRSKLIKLQFQHHNKHAKKAWKWGHDQNWGQKDLEWSCEFYPPKQVFLVFQSAKTHELPGAPPPGPLPGALPLDPTRGPKAGPWTPPVRAGLHGKPLAVQAMPCTLFPI